MFAAALAGSPEGQRCAGDPVRQPGVGILKQAGKDHSL